MTTLIVLFNLKRDADVSAYEDWAASVDIATISKLDNCERFDVYRCGGVLGSDGKAPYDYVEVIDVTDLAAFRQETAQDAIQQVAAEFRNFAHQPVFMVTERLAA